MSWGLGHSVLFNYRDSKDQPCVKQDYKLRLNTNTPRVAEPKCTSVLAPRVTTSPCQKWKSERSARKRRRGSGAVGADERSAREHLDRLVDEAVGAEASARKRSVRVRSGRRGRAVGADTEATETPSENAHKRKRPQTPSDGGATVRRLSC